MEAHGKEWGQEKVEKVVFPKHSSDPEVPQVGCRTGSVRKMPLSSLALVVWESHMQLSRMYCFDFGLLPAMVESMVGPHRDTVFFKGGFHLKAPETAL